MKIDELYKGSSNRTNRETFSGLNLSSLNVNSLIVAKQIKARKYLMKELRENQILCLQDTRIHSGDTNKYHTIHKWARENVLSHPRVFCTFSEQGKAGGAMIILPEKSLKTIITVDAISRNTIYIVYKSINSNINRVFSHYGKPGSKKDEFLLEMQRINQTIRAVRSKYTYATIAVCGDFNVGTTSNRYLIMIELNEI